MEKNQDKKRISRGIAVPSLSEITITPSPLLLTRRHMMIGYMQHTSLGIVLITALEIIH